MPPPNDSWLAPTLITGETGSSIGSNVDATMETGEPTTTGAGKTVWWKYTPTRTTKITFSTRRTEPLKGLPQTNFGTVVDAFTPVGPGIGNLLRASHADGRYAGFDIQNEVDVDVSVGLEYYIRIDGKDGSSGNILLWWEPKPDVYIGSCKDCAGTPVGEVCVGSWTPNITAVIGDGSIVDDIDFPAEKGVYIVRYCSGAWRFDFFHWVVARIPDDTYQGWPGQIVDGYFFHILYSLSGPRIAHLPEPNHGSATYSTAAQAMAPMRCSAVFFQHDGLSPIGLRFRDKFGQNDNPGVSRPTYMVTKVVPNFKEFTVQCADAGFGGFFNLTYIFDNLTDFDWNGVECTPQTTGGIATVNPLSRFVNVPRRTRVGFLVQVTISPPGKLDVFTTVKLSDGWNTFKDLHYDLTPRISLVSFSAAVVGGFPPHPNSWTATIQIAYSGLPVNVVATPSGDITNIRNPTTFAAQSSFTLLSSTLITFVFSPSPSDLRFVHITIALQQSGGGMNFPPISVTFSL